ncbi:MAG: putative metalloprotease CJM1_0395 family protein [Succinivibrio sp.]
MSLIDSSFISQQSSEVKSYQSHVLDLTSVNRREDDDKKKNTLLDDCVTLSGETQSNSDLFSSNRSKALKAYKTFSQEQNSVVEDPLKKTQEESEKTQKEKEQEKAKENNNDKKQNGDYLTDEEQQEVDSMKERDSEVRTHEQAHKNAGGSYAGSPQYEYEKGPDGKSYVTDGHVNIDISKESTPEKTIKKMKVVIAAANAPAEPSNQDRKVAAQAQQTLNEAQTELNSSASESKRENPKARSTSNSVKEFSS